jgi:diphthine methyl ester synthase
MHRQTALSQLISKDQESLYGKAIALADRDLVETEPETFLEPAKNGNVALLVVGDPLGATTHTSLLLSAREMGVEYEIIHNASIMNAISSTGLSLYNFGQTVSLVFFTDSWKPDSFYDRIAENLKLGLHTLVLLDIKVKEQSEENLCR